MKHIFTKKQAVSIINQAQNGIKEVDLMAPVDPSHKLFKLSNDELVKKLSKFMDEDSLADVVDED